MASVTQLGYLGIGVSDLARWEQFAANVLGLEVNGADADGSIFLRMDEYHHRFILRPGGEDDLAFVGWEVRDQVALNEILSSAKVSLDCGSPRRDETGNFVITLYATKAEAQKLAALKYRHELDEKYGDVLAERQKEVSKTDRFKGGKVKPQGLGIKK